MDSIPEMKVSAPRLIWNDGEHGVQPGGHLSLHHPHRHLHHFLLQDYQEGHERGSVVGQPL